MEDFRYIEGVTSLNLDRERCVGCGVCELVCPHGVFAMNGGRVEYRDKEACIECGACALNCAAGALSVSPGVGCAAYVINSWLKRKNKNKAAAGLGCC